MFRFPLRSQSSELSDSIYDPQRLEALFQNFERDAHLVLLFLKNLEKIELLTRSDNRTEPQLRFQVMISPSCVEYVRHQRKTFKQRIQPGVWMQHPVTITYPIVITTISYQNERVSKKLHKWVVNEYYAGGQASITLQTLHKDPVLSYVPLTGTAMLLGVAKLDKDEKEKVPLKDATSEEKLDDKEEESPQGQIFCFLPLPVEQRSATGLPVHVNGYFSISQNRRHLKWPTAGQNVKSDKSLLWNQCLLQEVVPKSYVELVLQVISSLQCF